MEKMSAKQYREMLVGTSIPAQFKDSINVAKTAKEPAAKKRYNDGNYAGHLIDCIRIKHADIINVDYHNDHVAFKLKGENYRITIQKESK